MNPLRPAGEPYRGQSGSETSASQALLNDSGAWVSSGGQTCLLLQSRAWDTCPVDTLVHPFTQPSTHPPIQLSHPPIGPSIHHLSTHPCCFPPSTYPSIHLCLQYLLSPSDGSNTLVLSVNTIVFLPFQSSLSGEGGSICVRYSRSHNRQHPCPSISTF